MRGLTEVSPFEKLFENAVYCGEYPDLKHGEATVHIHRFACPMMIDGEKAVAWLTAKQTMNVEGSERLYNLELEDIEKLAGTLEYLASHRLDTALPSASKDIVAQIEEAFKSYFEEVPDFSTFSANMEIAKEMEEIKAAAVADGMFMKAPNGKDSNLNERQWLQVRTKAFADWFGDWERVARFRAIRDEIMSMPAVATLSGKEFQRDGVPLTEKVPAYWNEVCHGVVVSPEIGEVVLDKEGVKSSMGHGIGSVKSAAFHAVPEVIQKGKVFDRQINWKDRGYDTVVIAAPVSIGDAEYICEVVAEQRPNRQGFYLHEVEVKEKLGNVFKTSTEGGTRQASRSILARRDAEVNTIWDNCSKVVDENGEPLVVYHGSLQRFDVFNDGQERHQSGAPDGTIFANDNRDIAVSFVDYYGGKADDVILDANDARHARMPSGVYRKGGVYPLFMNLKNPLVLDFQGMPRWSYAPCLILCGIWVSLMCRLWLVYLRCVSC